MDWQGLFNICYARLLATSMSTAASPHSHQPDVMALLVQGLLGCQKALAAAVTSADSGPLALFVQTIVSELEPMHLSRLGATRGRVCTVQR